MESRTDFGAISSEGTRAHQADACPAASDEADCAFEVEELACCEVGHACRVCGWWVFRLGLWNWV
jgi:hypothetical protein